MGSCFDTFGTHFASREPRFLQWRRRKSPLRTKALMHMIGVTARWGTWSGSLVCLRCSRSQTPVIVNDVQNEKMIVNMDVKLESS